MQDKHNHHYVSQVLSRKFMTNGKIYRFNKSTGYIKTLKSTKKLFSKEDLNSIIGKDGKINHNLVEDELNEYFENNFPKNYQILLDAAYSDFEVGKVLPNATEIEEAMEYVIGMALIGQARHPQRMKEQHDAIFGMLKTITDLATLELKNEINKYLEKVSPVNNKTPINFHKIKNAIRHYMGDVRFGIMRAPENHYFILPDCSSAIKRFPIAPNIIDGETFYNPSMHIGLTLMPINSKVLITATSRDLLPEEFNNEPSGFHNIDGTLALSYNNILFEAAYNEVACENREFLEKFVDGISQ